MGHPTVEEEPYGEMGRRLRTQREARSISRRKMVELLRGEGISISVSSLQDLEIGKRLNFWAMKAMARILNCPLAYLLGLEEGA